MGRLWKRWIDTVKDCLRNRGMSGKQGEWCRIGVNGMGCSPGYEPLTLMRCHSCGLPHLYEALEGLKSICGGAYNLKGIKGKNSFLSFSSFQGMMHADPGSEEGVMFNK